MICAKTLRPILAGALLVLAACGGSSDGSKTLMIPLAEAQPVATPQEAAEQANFTYPNTRRENVVDTYHGTEITDAYRWLERSTHHAWRIAHHLDALRHETAPLPEVEPPEPD